MIKQRLLVSGCSFTDYAWPTWADYLGLAFEQYDNVGQAGSDNACIARNIIQNAQAGDLVVIMWSGWNRHVMWLDGDPTPKNPNNHWQYRYNRWDKNWLVNFYNPNERLASSMDYVQMIDLHSQIVGYTAHHFSAFPWQLGEIEKNKSKFFNKIYDQYSISNNHLMLESLQEFQETQGHFVEIDSYINGMDPHPTPRCHWEYVKQRMAPQLNIELNLDIEQQVDNHHARVLEGNVDFDKSKQGLLK